MHRDDLDERLFCAMQARPLPEPNPDLIVRAMTKATAREAAASARQTWLITRSRRVSLLNALAAVLVIGVTAVAFWQSVPSSSAPGGAITQMQDVDDTAEGTELSDEAATILICGILLFGTFLYAIVEQSMGEPRQASWVLTSA